MLAMFLTYNVSQDSPFYSGAFYPGQKVAGPPKAFKDAKWLSGSKPIIGNQSQLKAVVEQVMISHDDVILIIIGNQSQLKAVVEQVMISHDDVILMVIIHNQSQLKAVVEQVMISHHCNDVILMS